MWSKLPIILLLTLTTTTARSHSVQHYHHGVHQSQHGHNPTPHKSITPIGEPNIYDKSIYTGSNAVPVKQKSRHELPSDYSWCNVDGTSYCTSSWNQHIPVYCGSCYIHGALAQANDRIKIALQGKQDVILARQVILNCGPQHGLGAGCDGGEGYDIFEYMYRYGLPDESCQQYIAKSSGTCGAIDVCSNCMPIGEDIFPFKCWAVDNPILYYVKSYGQVSGELAMMSEIYERGPITCGFASTDDFDYNYQGGIYIDTTNATDMNHDVEVVGWGYNVEDDIPYWIARNSWGTYWGENSFFRIIRGVNNMMFESDCTFALMDTTPIDRINNGEFIGGMYGLHQPNITTTNNHHQHHSDVSSSSSSSGSSDIVPPPTVNEEQYKYYMKHGADKQSEYKYMKVLIDAAAMELNQVAYHKHIRKHHHTSTHTHAPHKHTHSNAHTHDTTPDESSQPQQNVSEILGGVAKIIHESINFVPGNQRQPAEPDQNQSPQSGYVPVWQRYIPNQQPVNQPIDQPPHHIHDRHLAHRTSHHHSSLHHHHHHHHLPHSMSLNEPTEHSAPVRHDGSINDIVTSNHQYSKSASHTHTKSSVPDQQQYLPQSQSDETQSDSDVSTPRRNLLNHRHHFRHQHHHHHYDDSAAIDHSNSILDGGKADSEAIDSGGNIAGKYSSYPTGQGYGDAFAKQWNGDAVSKFAAQRGSGADNNHASHEPRDKHDDDTDSNFAGTGDYQHYIDQYSNGGGAQSGGTGSSSDWTKYQDQYAGGFAKYTHGQDRPEKGQWYVEFNIVYYNIINST